jgi:hypothetical protein
VDPRGEKPKLRLLDHCRHFVGEVANEKLRIYCSRCRQFLDLTLEEIREHFTTQGV